ncbi:MAG: hypothetical protein ACRD24_13645 [Terriglobales bacterium]
MPLTNIQVDKAEPEAKDRKLFDEKGLYLLVKLGRLAKTSPALLSRSSPVW